MLQLLYSVNAATSANLGGLSLDGIAASVDPPVAPEVLSLLTEDVFPLALILVSGHQLSRTKFCPGTTNYSWLWDEPQNIRLVTGPPLGILSMARGHWYHIIWGQPEFWLQPHSTIISFSSLLFFANRSHMKNKTMAAHHRRYHLFLVPTPPPRDRRRREARRGAHGTCHVR